MHGVKPSGTGNWFRAIARARSGPVAFAFYAAIRTLFAIMQVFPLEWNLGTARVLARIWPRLRPRDRRRAIAHLTAAFGDDYTSAQIERIADRSLESVAMFAVEAVCLPRLIHAYSWSRYIRLGNFDEALKLMISGNGVILVTGHYGSFEVTGHVLACLGFDVAAVMRPLDNVYLNRFLVAGRRTRGLQLLDKKGASERARQMLEDGFLLGFIGDQDAGRKGLFVDFFGRPASTYKSIGLLAMATSSPIVVGYARRCRTAGKPVPQGGVYELGVAQIIRPEEWEAQADPLRWITQTYTAAIERIVRAAPEQYLWMHRRWKSQPERARTRRRSGEDGHAAPDARQPVLHRASK